MSRYFLELSYKGTRYSGFQVQHNAETVQAEMEKALAVYFRQNINLTGSSRTDTGVHALQNYFHFDFDGQVPDKFIYNINAILPSDIVVKNIVAVAADAHCRFDASSREYVYHLYGFKDPFMDDRAWFYPYPLNLNMLEMAAATIKEYEDFTSFSKRNTQVKTFRCKIQLSEWRQVERGWEYRVRANRFLRGMVRGLVGTMLQVGREKISIREFRDIIESKNCENADFTTPAHGLFLVRVSFADGYFENKK